MEGPVSSGLGEIPLLGELAVALLLSSLIGLEREIRAKSAGLRTHSLVGLGTALFMVVSQHGFTSVLGDDVMLDPSRVAAQILTGIGFIGGGLIFVRRDAVQGLTTAASVWVTAAVGMASGGGLFVLAVATTAAHFLVVAGYPWLTRHLRGSWRQPSTVRIGYLEGRGVLRGVLSACTSRGWTVLDLHVEYEDRAEDHRTVVVVVELRGRGSLEELVRELTGLPGVLHVAGGADAAPRL
ncbi:MgtC/SapB family protein [Actinoalloteichus caeruleus]|uniref:Mg2+ transporter-C (MgtC) family protein n=1 Tax=Actinoalloteichus caeruleus DSM 43889 TaxID=1120930 RepID=A0ABT1JGB8_ACTCY|nr:MgtC/SapB family protein [Actinoalloteichus caeruleus]MCP2331216.1 putative Mg2+ transporter-C (MgtC) family protein [Actinoalloteichus caeruleus DSM 43889]